MCKEYVCAHALFFIFGNAHRRQLKAYYEANSNKLSVSTDQHLHWKNRARKALRLGYSKSTGDMEMAEPMGSA